MLGLLTTVTLAVMKLFGMAVPSWWVVLLPSYVVPLAFSGYIFLLVLIDKILCFFDG
jgi:hypothetical protein